MDNNENNKLIDAAVPNKSIPVAWLILRPMADGKIKNEIIPSPLTDDTVMGYGDEAWPLYVMVPNA